MVKGTRDLERERDRPPTKLRPVLVGRVLRRVADLRRIRVRRLDDVEPLCHASPGVPGSRFLDDNLLRLGLDETAQVALERKLNLDGTTSASG